MAGSSATLAIKVIADTKQAQAELGNASGKVGKFQSGMSKLAVPAAIAGAAILKFGASAVSAAQESETANKRLAAVFKATGDETGKSAAQAQKYAETLSRQIGVDDEVIKAGEAKLATFKKVSDQTAMMNGVFERATAAGADLAAAGFGSIESNAVLLGKALNDPIKGMAALARVGVTLTDQQKKQAEAMAEAGDVAGAQKVILKAVEGQVKGTAAATATGSDKMKVAFGEFQESFGKALLPVVQKGQKLLGGLADVMNENVRVVQIVVGVIGLLVVAILAVNAAFKIYEATQKAIILVQKAVWLTSPIGLVLLAVLAVVAAFVVLYNRSKTFRDFVNAMWAQIKKAAAVVGAAIKRFVGQAIKAVTGFVRDNKQQFQTAWAVVKAIAKVLGAAIKTYFKVAFAAVKIYLGVLKVVFTTAFNLIKNAIKLVVAIFKGDWRGAFEAVKGMLRAFRDFFVGIWNVFKRPIQAVINLLRKGLGGALDFLRDRAISIGGTLSQPFEDLWDWVNKVIDAVESLIGWIGKIDVPDIHLPNLPGGFSLPGSFSAAPLSAQPSLARGVTGTTSTATGRALGGPTIIIQGALDPEAVARQVQRILASHDRRVGVA